MSRRDTAQLLLFVRGITDFNEVHERDKDRERPLHRGKCMHGHAGTEMGQTGGVTTDGCPNLTGKNVGLLKRMQDKDPEMDADEKLVFLHCIIHQHVLCKSELKINHVVHVVTKIENFIRARASNHRQFVALLEESDTEHSDISYHTAVRTSTNKTTCCLNISLEILIHIYILLVAPWRPPS